MLDYEKLEELRTLAVMPEDMETVFWTAPRLDKICLPKREETDRELVEDGSDKAKAELARRDLTERCNLRPLILQYAELEAMRAGYLRGSRGNSMEQLGVRVQTGFAMSAGATWEDAICDRVDAEHDADKAELHMIFSRADVARKFKALRRKHPRARVPLTLLEALYLHGGSWRVAQAILPGRRAETALRTGLLIWADEMIDLDWLAMQAGSDWDSDDDRIG